MAVNLSPVYGVAGQLFNDNGDPLAGGKIYTYLAGTTTNAATYTTSAGNIAHSNPIVLDGAGRVPSGEIWLIDGITYKFVVEDPVGALIGTYDNLVGINSNFVAYTNSQEIQTATAGQTVFNLTTMQYQPGTNSLSVFVDGVNQYGPGASYAYVETNSDTVTFLAGLHVGALVKFTTSQIQNANALDASQVTYTAPYAGAVVSNVEEKLAETVSIDDFGASPSASGATNRAAIVAAFAASTSVYVPPGTYAVSGDTITIPDGTEFFGAGKYATTINFTPNGDKDCFVIGWYTTLRDMKIVDQYVSAGNYGTLRLQSLTNPEIPTNVGGNNWTDPAIGGLSYKNSLRNLILESGHNYNIYMVNVAYIDFCNVRAVLARNTAGNVSIWGKGGVNLPASTTVFMSGSNEFTASTAGPGLTLENVNNSYLQFIAEGNKGRGVTASGDLVLLTFKECYLESNFALGASTGDAEMVIAGNTTSMTIENCWFYCNNSYRGFVVSPGYTYSGLNIARSCTVPVTGTNTGAAVNVPTNAPGWSIEFNNDFLTNNTDDYNETLIRAQGKIWPQQTFNSSPYSFVQNSLFKTWSSTEPAGWSTPFSAAPVIKNTSQLYYGSTNSMEFDTYPSAASYLNIQNNLEWEQKNYCLVLVGKNGQTVSSATPGYDGTARTYVLISVGATNYFLDIPETTFGSEWTAYQWDLAALFGNDLPTKSAITGFGLYLVCTAGTIIGHAGIYANDAPYQIPE